MLRRDEDPFRRQKRGFPSQGRSSGTPLKAPQSAIRTDHSVTGYLRRPGVPFQGLADRAGGTTPDRAGDIGIGGHEPTRNLLNHLIHPLLKGGGIAPGLNAPPDHGSP